MPPSAYSACASGFDEMGYGERGTSDRVDQYGEERSSIPGLTEEIDGHAFAGGEELESPRRKRRVRKRTGRNIRYESKHGAIPAAYIGSCGQPAGGGPRGCGRLCVWHLHGKIAHGQHVPLLTLCLPTQP